MGAIITFLVGLLVWVVVGLVLLGFAIYLVMAIRIIFSRRPVYLPWYGWLQAGDGK